MHEMRRLRDFYSLGVRQKALKLSDESNAEYGWTSFPGNKHRGSMDAADIGCTKRWEAGPKQLRDLGRLVLVQHALALFWNSLEALLAEQRGPEDPPSTLHVTGTVGLRRRLYHS